MHRQDCAEKHDRTYCGKSANIITLPTDVREIDDNEDGDFILKAGASPRTAQVEALVETRRLCHCR